MYRRFHVDLGEGDGAMPDYTRSLTYWGAYRIDATLLNDLYDAVERFIEFEDPEVTISFVGGHKLESASDTKEILNDSLIRKHVINELQIEGRNKDFDARRRFRLRA